MAPQRQPNLFVEGGCVALTAKDEMPTSLPDHVIWHGDVEEFLDSLPDHPLFDLVVSSPPCKIGKDYEERARFDEYLAWQRRVISKCVSRLRDTGSVCWQVGNHVRRTGRTASILPLDLAFHPIFDDLGLTLRNRIVWTFGHGLHCTYRFSGRYEVVLWYTRSDSYTFDLDAVRVPQKYPGKKQYKGPRAGKYSCNPLGKNPSDVWEIPNVKSNHVEKTAHPCQFPVALVDRLVCALTEPHGLVFDPFAGAASAGVAAAMRDRRFWGCETVDEYVELGLRRVSEALMGTAKIRPLDRPIYDHTKAGKLARNPFGGEEEQ
jgi:adenine-specific DNA-methyltransferase